MMDTAHCSKHAENYFGILSTIIVIGVEIIPTGFETLLSFPKAGVKPYSLGPQFICAQV